jgi:hypothetical protein
MKIKSLNLKNFANYKEVSASFDENVTYLIGGNGSGKTTLGLTGIHFAFEGIAERAKANSSVLIGERFRFIGDYGRSAGADMVLHDEVLGVDIKVIRKITKDANMLSFEAPEGMKLDQEWLSNLFNVFLINPMAFASMSPKEQALSLDIDTDSFDLRIAEAKKEQTEKNAVYNSIHLPEVAPEKAEKVALADLIQQRDAIAKANSEALNAYNEEILITTRQVQDHNAKVATNAARILELETIIKSAQDELAGLKKDVLHKMELPEFVPFSYQSTEELDEKINTASQTNEKAAAYETYLQDKKRKDAAREALSSAKSKVADIQAERLEYIKSAKLPFAEMEIGEDGGLLVKGRPLKAPYFSTGELLRMIPSIHAARNPELKYVYLQDFNLLDRENQQKVEENLLSKGFQLVIEYVGESKLIGKNCIVLTEEKAEGGVIQEKLL